jgi:hypothetical protein
MVEKIITTDSRGNIFVDGEKVTFVSGEKVIFTPRNEIYDFGYIGQTGKAIIYIEGERNMQDSYAVDLGLLKRLEE